MNRENANKLADFLETLPEECFAMNLYSNATNGCMTVGCIAGWCTEIFCGIGRFGDDYRHKSDGTAAPHPVIVASTWLGLKPQESGLFLDFDLTKDDAVRILRAGVYPLK